ncbi:MAG: cation:proton antiporter, partial [Bacteroidota bacterium]
MNGISTEIILILLGALIVLSYLFSMFSRVTKVPSVLLLLATGIFLRYLADYFKFPFILPGKVVELFGAIGLIMIVLEAGLDLQLAKNKLKLIRQAVLSALIIFIASAAVISAILHYWLHEPVIHCIIYSIPLSIMSSSIVLPSLHHLNETKKDFLVYEASFSDIIGILIFNYFIG